tara:strand:- start:1626 stop:2183 length:558 start_codon:yes stop_codon:yes gene_type:complete
MATTNTGISKFKSNFQGGARPNLFECRVTFPDNNQALREQSRFLIKATSGIPTSAIGQIEIPFRGRNLKIAGDMTFAEAWQITVINDVDFNLRDAFEGWVNRINNHEANVSDDAIFGQHLGYMRNMEMVQLDRDGDENGIKTYTFVDAFPTNVSAIALAADSNDAIEEFTVDFQYQYWTAEGVTS